MRTIFFTFILLHSTISLGQDTKTKIQKNKPAIKPIPKTQSVVKINEPKGLDLIIKQSTRKIKFERKGNTIIVGKAFKQEMMKSDHAKILSEFKIDFARHQGQNYGIRLVDIKKGSLLQQAGFKPGDVIKTVNGKSVVSPRNMMKIFKIMAGAH